MESTSFIVVQKVRLNVESNFIGTLQFLQNIFLDLGIVIISIILWKIFWYPIKRLSVWDLKNGRYRVIGSESDSISKCIRCFYFIMKNLTSLNNYILNQSGFEAFAYLFFLRRFAHLMAIITITDICIWIPYQLYFESQGQFSLISMQNSKNQLFQTAYILWNAVVIFYGISNMKNYLHQLLKFKYFREPKNYKKRLLNNFKSKTIRIHFVGESIIENNIQFRTKLIEKLKIEDSILAFTRIQNHKAKLEIQYQYQIVQLVKEFKMENMPKYWRTFKEEEELALEQKLQSQIKRVYSLQQEMNKKQLNQYLVVFQHFQTAQNLVNQFKFNQAVSEYLPNCECNQSDILSHYQQRHTKLVVNWAQQPNDIIWINFGASQKVLIIKRVSFNFLSVLLIFVSFSAIILAKSKDLVNPPKILLPYLMSIINSSLRWLISKSSQWQNHQFQNELQLSEFKVLIVYFFINVIIGSIVRNTLNLVDILTSGWGWLQLIGLIYKKPDGMFYYIYILNQIALAVFSSLMKLGDLFHQVLNVPFTYEKNTRIRHKSKYGTNDPFRFGYSYSNDVIILALILMYSASSPLIHLFGLMYFLSKFYLNGYTIILFHQYEETCSNLRILDTVCEYIQTIMLIVIFIFGVTMMFAKQYSNVLILYISIGVFIWLMKNEKEYIPTLKDYFSDEELSHHDLTDIVELWKTQYKQSMQPIILQ